MNLPFKMVHGVISTNFELEPVLEQYVKTYPDGELHNYRIIYKTTGEHHCDSRSYIIVFEYVFGRNSSPGLAEYLQSYCTLHNLVATSQHLNRVFPDITGKIPGGSVYGKLLEKQEGYRLS